jgi:hypothetical protein
MPDNSNDIPYTDDNYKYDDAIIYDGEKKKVSQMITEIHDAGWEIGIHPTWNAATDEEELRYQKHQLESVIDSKIKSVRQHYLHYDIQETPSIHSSVGLKYDSSLGYNANIGFRFGTSYPWELYDWSARESSDILEVPLIIQDVGLFRDRGLGLDRDTALEYIKMLTSRVKDVSGVLTISWHPSYIIRDEWLSVYKQVLQYLKHEGAWFTTIQQLGDWWKGNRM